MLFLSLVKNVCTVYCRRIDMYSIGLIIMRRAYDTVVIACEHVDIKSKSLLMSNDSLVEQHNSVEHTPTTTCCVLKLRLR